jgi:hypothetical protein
MKRIAIAYNPYLVRLGVVLAIVTAIAALLYGIFLLEAVAETAKRTVLEREVRALTVKLGGLQAQSLKLTKELTAERARALGFTDPTHVSTVFATEATRNLSRLPVQAGGSF